MKKVLKYIGFLAAALTLASCIRDNYKQPDATIFGQAIDEETDELIIQDLGSNGSKIDIYEIVPLDENGENPEYSGSKNIRQLNFRTDGNYMDRNFFSGKYHISATRTNFLPLLEEDIDLHPGMNEYNFRTLPYCRVKLDSIGMNEKKQQIWASFTVERTTEDNLKTVRLFCDENANVCQSINNSGDNGCKIEVNAANDPEKHFVLKMPVDMLKDGKTYYFRVGALTSVAEATYNYSEAVRITLVKGEAEPPKRPGIPFEEITSNDGWFTNGGSFDPNNKKYGAGSLVAPTGGVVLFQKKLETPLDISDKMPLDGAGVLLTIYVSDISKFNRNADGQFEICSGGDCDKDERNWQWMREQWGLVDGWNEVFFPFSKAGKTGNLDISHINFMRMYHTGNTAGATVAINEIRFVYPTLIEPFDAIGEDNDHGKWRGQWGTVTVDETAQKEGDGCISIDITGDGPGLFYSKFVPTNAPACTKANGWMKVWMFIGDAEKWNTLTDGQFELTSGGAPDAGEINWPMQNWFKPLETGWNEVKVKMSNAGDTGGGLDIPNLNYIRVYVFGLTKGFNVKVDGLQIYQDGFEPVEDDE